MVLTLPFAYILLGSRNMCPCLPSGACPTQKIRVRFFHAFFVFLLFLVVTLSFRPAIYSPHCPTRYGDFCDFCISFFLLFLIPTLSFSRLYSSRLSNYVFVFFLPPGALSLVFYACCVLSRTSSKTSTRSSSSSSGEARSALSA